MNIKIYQGKMLPEYTRSFIMVGNRAFNWTRHITQADWEHAFSRYFVLEEEGEPLGYVACHHLFERLEVNGVYVEPKRRRQGYGRLLLEAVLAYAQEAGCERVLLEVRESNTAAIALYQNLNFTCIDKRAKYYHQPSEDALIMLYQIERRLEDDTYISD